MVREVQVLGYNVHQLNCDGLALTLISALVTFHTLQQAV